MDMERISRVGIRAAYRAGEILNDFFNRSFKVSKKGDIDLVTEADVASEQAVIATISDSFPDHAILAEESGGSGGAGPYEWIIDPLDGTTNFAHRLPLFAVSIACRLETQMIFGCVFNPVNNELFSAVRGQGAQLNGQPVCTSRVGTVAESLLVTGFPYTVRTIAPEAILSRFTRCLTAAQGVRRLGSAALDLCCVACGRFDGFWEENLQPWDTAAGVLIAEEGGARVSNYAGGPFDIQGKQILATNARIHSEMLALLQ